jgi:hypothetical protein
MDWNYTAGHVDISMPKYIPAMLRKLQYPTPTKPQHAPHQWTVPVYGRRLQMAPTDDSTPLPPKGIKRVQSVIGSILYYARAVDPTMLPALNDISSKQAKATINTEKQCKMLLDYATTYPNAKIRYYAVTSRFRRCIPRPSQSPKPLCRIFLIRNTIIYSRKTQWCHFGTLQVNSFSHRICS